MLIPSLLRFIFVTATAVSMLAMDMFSCTFDTHQSQSGAFHFFLNQIEGRLRAYMINDPQE